MIPLNKCRWIFQIRGFDFSREKSFTWRAETKTMDKDYNYQYANGGIGHIDCVRIFNNIKEARKHIRYFAKLNKIDRFKIEKKKE